MSGPRPVSRAGLPGAIVAAVGARAACPRPARARCRSVQSGHRPGPDILYARPARAPQLENTGVWRAQPILISGASAYRDGEFLYQDLLYDDHGARGARDPADPAHGRTRAPRRRTAPTRTRPTPPTPATPPTSSSCGSSRCATRPPSGSRSTRSRTRRSSRSRSRSAARRACCASFPHGASATAPARPLPDRARRRAPTCSTRPPGSRRAAPPSVEVDRGAVSSTCASRTRTGIRALGTVRLAAGVGLWDRQAGRYLVPGAAADATTPGRRRRPRRADARSSTSPSAAPEPSRAPTSACSTERRPGGATGCRRRRCARKDISPFYARRRLRQARRAAPTTTCPAAGGVPQNGPMDRILVSHFETARASTTRRAACRHAAGVVHGRVPRPAPALRDLRARASRGRAAGTASRCCCTPTAATYNQYSTSRNQSQLGERGDGSIVITPEGRGPDGWYYDYAGRRHVRGLGRRRAPLPARSRTGRRSPATRWAATAPTSSRRSSPTCSRARSRPSGPSGVWAPRRRAVRRRTTRSSRRCATSRS